MGVDVQLEGEDGNCLRSIPDPKGVIARLLPTDDPRYPLLRYVDLYGNTIFNRAQCQQVVAELELLEKAHGRSAEETKVLDQLKKLATECGQEPHFYLKFIGD